MNQTVQNEDQFKHSLGLNYEFLIDYIVFPVKQVIFINIEIFVIF